MKQKLIKFTKAASYWAAIVTITALWAWGLHKIIVNESNYLAAEFREEIQREAIGRGYGQFDPATGLWRWKTQEEALVAMPSCVRVEAAEMASVLPLPELLPDLDLDPPEVKKIASSKKK